MQRACHDRLREGVPGVVLLLLLHGAARGWLGALSRGGREQGFDFFLSPPTLFVFAAKFSFQHTSELQSSK